MKFSNSPLVQYTHLSPYFDKRTRKITKISPHHMAGVLSAETCGRIFDGADPVSSNYGIGYDGKIGMYVEEKNAAWTSCSEENDQQAVTIEISNSLNGGNWPVSDHVLKRFIELATDICIRNDIPKLVYTGDERGTVTLHKFFWATACPGPFLTDRMPKLVQEINQNINKQVAVSPTSGPSELFRVQTGAFKVRSNAEVLKKKIEKLGYSVWLVISNGFFKLQVGAFSKRSNAEAFAGKVKFDFKKAYGEELQTFITEKTSVAPSPTPPKPKIKEDDIIKIRPGAIDLNTGGTFAGFVYKLTYKVMEVGPDYISFGDGDIYTGKIKKSDALKV